MSTSSIITAAVSITILWGGFGYCLYIAMKKK
ncbi:MetS family NSS transporter small subunit [uncultured Ilyobacter sp.]|nr:MetS family NSS transporter small subunit [uncultured Ilyobacter sp.]